MGNVKDCANWLLYVLEKVSKKEHIRYKWSLPLYEFIWLCIWFIMIIPIYLIIYPFRRILNIKFT